MYALHTKQKYKSANKSKTNRFCLKIHFAISPNIFKYFKNKYSIVLNQGFYLQE